MSKAQENTFKTAEFVWLRGLKGPEPQKWFDPDPQYKSREDRLLKRHPLTPALAALSLEELANIFPAPPVRP